MQEMVKTERMERERRESGWIMKEKNKSVWKVIKRLMNSGVEKKVVLVGEDGEVLTAAERRRELTAF